MQYLPLLLSQIFWHLHCYPRLLILIKFIETSALVLFIILIYIIDVYLRKNSTHVLSFFEKLRTGAKSEKLVFGSIILSGLIISTVFEFIGITYVLGAFFAGILISDVVIGEDLLGIITRTLSRINDSFFIPLFFSIAGLSFTFPDEAVMETMIVILLGTLLVGGIGDYVAGQKLMKPFTARGTMGVLGGRGAVGIIIATISLGAGIINDQEYSAAIFATIIISFIFSSVFSSFVKKSDSPVIDMEKTSPANVN